MFVLHKIKNMNRKKQILQAIRFDVWKTRFGNNMESRKCPCCNLNELSLTNFDCGHIISAKNGGNICPENLIPICGSCNNSIGSCNMNDFAKSSGLDWKRIKCSLGGKWSDDSKKGWVCCFSSSESKGKIRIESFSDYPPNETKFVEDKCPLLFKLEFAKKVDENKIKSIQSILKNKIIDEKNLIVIKSIFDLADGLWYSDLIMNNRPQNSIIEDNKNMRYFISEDCLKTAMEKINNMASEPLETETSINCYWKELSSDTKQYFAKFGDDFFGEDINETYKYLDDNIDVCQKILSHFYEQEILDRFPDGIDPNTLKCIDCLMLKFSDKIITEITKRAYISKRTIEYFFQKLFDVISDVIYNVEDNLYEQRLFCKLRIQLYSTDKVVTVLNKLSKTQLRFLGFLFGVRNENKREKMIESLREKINIKQLRNVFKCCDENESYVGIYYSDEYYYDRNFFLCDGCLYDVECPQINYYFSEEIDNSIECSRECLCPGKFNMLGWEKNIFSPSCLCTKSKCVK